MHILSCIYYLTYVSLLFAALCIRILQLFGGLEDLQRAPWGSVALVQTRQIHTHSHTLYRGVPISGGGGGGSGHTKQQGKGVLCLLFVWMVYLCG